ncbi:MAG: riboflavin synthase [Alphaproteobacteria bacterium]|nr:riboflavin synthase [Alphaproteobacteria bacterium]
MFTGITTDLGEVVRIEKEKGDWRLSQRCRYDLDKVKIGASISCDGCCLTVVDKELGAFAVDVSHETRSKTTIGQWEEGRRVNLELSMKVGDELGGHIVSGHIDGLATLEDVARDGDSHRLTISVPDSLAQYIAPKGSVALNGVSLTVNEVEGNRFGVNIIPHTWAVTNLGYLQPGDALNLEVDMLARYVARILGK